jgi:two-component system response regulator YesN
MMRNKKIKQNRIDNIRNYNWRGTLMYRLVVVDDEPKILNGIVETYPWENWGYSVTGAFTSSLKALDYMKKHPVDVLLTDVYMPIMDGIELTKKAQDVRSELDVVFISGFRDFEFAKNAINLGVKQYITKPLNYSEILETFRKIKQKLDQKQETKITSASLCDFPPQYHNKLIAVANEYVENNIATASLQNTSEQVGLSAGYFSKLYKEKTGYGFSDYLLKAKMYRAMQLLGDVRQRIYEVAFQVGYKNPKNFSRAFRQYFGVSPTEYREGKSPKHRK